MPKGNFISVPKGFLYPLKGFLFAQTSSRDIFYVFGDPGEQLSEWLMDKSNERTRQSLLYLEQAMGLYLLYTMRAGEEEL